LVINEERENHLEATDETKLLTPKGGVLHEKIAGRNLVKKFPAFYGTRRFITAFTSMSLS
jgi:hypothetical protein